MTKWANENAYDGLIWPEANRSLVSPYLVKAVIAAESAFNPRARRPESPRDSLPPTKDHPAGGDESRGLMQLLVRTARALGYAGPIEGLDDPALSIAYGTRLLANNFRATKTGVLKGEPEAKQWDAAIAAYNAGWSKARQGDAPRVGNTIATPFVNQTYVDRVRGFQRYFETIPAGPTSPTKPPATPAALTDGGCATHALALATAVAVVLAAAIAAIT